jgi:hypothetical protein
MAGTEAAETGAGGSGKDAEPAQPRHEVVLRTVREVSGHNWPQLTRTNYGEWAVTMKVKLRARWLWTAIEKGTDNEDDDVSAMEALLSSTPQEYHQMLGDKKNAKEAWDALASMRFGSDRAKKAKVQQLCCDFDDMKFHPDESVEDFGLLLQSLVGQLVVFGKVMEEEEVVSKFLCIVPPKYT